MNTESKKRLTLEVVLGLCAMIGMVGKYLPI